MDHGWALVMVFQLTGAAAGVQGHGVVWVCAAVSATIRIHDSNVPLWWPHPSVCVFMCVFVDYDHHSPCATLQCIQPTGQNSLLQNTTTKNQFHCDMDRNIHFSHLNNQINSQWAHYKPVNRFSQSLWEKKQTNKQIKEQINQ